MTSSKLKEGGKTTSKVIQAIVIDGFHKGHVVRMPYYPTIKLMKPIVVMVDTCCYGDELPPEPAQPIEYKECFRAVDQEIVLYSTTGKSEDLHKWFGVALSDKPWRADTTLYMGFHDGFLRREDGNSADVEYERGFKNGMIEQARKSELR